MIKCSLLISLLLITTIRFAFSFNLDLEQFVLYQSPDAGNTMFGYAVNLFVTGKDNPKDNYVLIGAPKANTSQPGVVEGGHVYRCSVTSGSCTPIPFDREGHTRRLNGSELLDIDSKSRQFFGATIATSATPGDSRVLACAPLFQYFYTTFDKHEPIGHCYLARDNFASFEEYAPVRIEGRFGPHRLGFAMTGFSASVPNIPNKLYFGAPGLWYNQGAFVVDLLRHGRGTQRYTREGPEINDDTYMGYSMASGDLDGDGRDDAVLGVPKAYKLFGMAAIYNEHLDSIQKLVGEQEGSYFGASVSTGDINGDGLADVIVGSPLFSLHERENGALKTKYEVGRVYVYYQTKGKFEKFQRFTQVTGEDSWGRFGQSVAFAGDLNQDGFGDFFVGAPFAGLDRNGAVYVFQGSKEGFKERYSQKILPSAFKSQISTFGWSLSSAKDVDNNQYPDVAVGAFRSNNALLLRARPVIYLNGWLEITPKTLDLTTATCPFDKDINSACGKIQFCLSYRGVNVPPAIQLETLLSLDYSNTNARIALMEPRGQYMQNFSMPLNRSEVYCQDHLFFVLPTMRDKLSPIEVAANFSLKDDVQTPLRGELKPILDMYSAKTISDRAMIARDCGLDNVCVPDLSLSAKLLVCSNGRIGACVEKNEYLIGKDQYVNLTVEVTNKGEHAYEGVFYLILPPGLEFLHFQKMSNSQPAICSSSQDQQMGELFVMKCDLGNPMLARSQVHLSFRAKLDDYELESLELELIANSTNTEDDATLKDNHLILPLNLELKPQIFLFNRSEPQHLFFSEQDYVDSRTFIWDYDIGPNVTHLYQLRNDGPAEIKKASVEIFWPSRMVTGENLLYLSLLPRVWGPGHCVLADSEAMLNPEGLGVYPRHPAELSRQRRMAAKPVIQPPEESKIDDNLFSRTVKKVRKLGDQIRDLGELKRFRVDCTNLQCTRILCDVGPIPVDGYVVLSIESHLWLNSLINSSLFDATISSAAIATIQEMNLPVKKNLLVTAVATTFISPRDPTRTFRGAPWWLWLIAALTGLVFLFLIGIVLWKMGFFERRKPPQKKAELRHSPILEDDFYGQPCKTEESLILNSAA